MALTHYINLMDYGIVFLVPSRILYAIQKNIVDSLFYSIFVGTLVTTMARKKIIRVRVTDTEYNQIWNQCGGTELSTYLRGLAINQNELRQLRSWKERVIPVLETLRMVKHESMATEIKLRTMIDILLETK